MTRRACLGGGAAGAMHWPERMERELERIRLKSDPGRAIWALADERCTGGTGCRAPSYSSSLCSWAARLSPTGRRRSAL